METLEVYTIDDGVEKVIIHDVRLPTSSCHDALMADLCDCRHMYVPLLPISVNVDVRSHPDATVLRRQTRQPVLQYARTSIQSHLYDYHLTVGSEPLDALATHIWQSVGPSGRNKVTSSFLLDSLFRSPDVRLHTHTGLLVPARRERSLACTRVF